MHFFAVCLNPIPTALDTIIGVPSRRHSVAIVRNRRVANDRHSASIFTLLFLVGRGLRLFRNQDGQPCPSVLDLLVDGPRLDPGALRVFPECPGTSILVQICWTDGEERPNVLSRLTSWLHRWLDQGSFQGQVTIQFQEADREFLRCG